MSARNALPRRRRALPSTLAALAVLVLAALGSVAAFQVASGRDRTVLGDASDVAARLRDHDWTDVGVLVAGVVLAAAGLLLLLAGLLPARRSLVQLADVDAHTVTGITRGGLTRDLAAVAVGVDGIGSARVRLRRGRARVTARSPLRDVSGMSEAVESAVGERLSVLAPVRPIAVRAVVRGSG
ncbi:Asp23/Gls24 family envelope stress response protein [Jatrophihabitans fulvus]